MITKNIFKSAHIGLNRTAYQKNQLRETSSSAQEKERERERVSTQTLSNTLRWSFQY